jgi:hypothetical protein
MNWTRQKIDSWPASIDDQAREDGWKHKYDLEKTTVDMLENLSKSENKSLVLKPDFF